MRSCGCRLNPQLSVDGRQPILVVADAFGARRGNHRVDLDRSCRCLWLTSKENDHDNHARDSHHQPRLDAFWQYATRHGSAIDDGGITVFWCGHLYCSRCSNVNFDSPKAR